MSATPSAEVLAFIGTSTNDNYREAYDKRVREVCRADASQTGFRVSNEDMDKDPLASRQKLINFRAAFQVASQLNVSVQRQFDLTVESGRHPPSTPYEQRLVAAFATVGVSEVVVKKMVEEARMKVTPIPTFVTI